MTLFSRSDLRLFCLAVLMFLGLGRIVARLWELQVMRGDVYASKIGSKSQVTVRIPSVRGEIRDRNGIPLVQNRASYSVDFYLQDMENGFRRRYGAVPKFLERRTQRQMMKEIPTTDIIKVVNTAVIPRLEDLNLARDYNAKHLKNHYAHDTLVPFPYIEDADFNTIARFSEHDVGLPGVEISQRPVRQYLYGAFAAHILGYVGMPREIYQLPDVHSFTYYQPDVEGKSQIEQSMDSYLRGKPGARVMQRDAKGRMESEVRVDAPKPGANVYLTLDARIQYIVEQALRHPSLGRAAAVVIDPNNGDILAMASIPSFDPNIFIPSVSLKDWNVLLKDPAVPLVNRAVSGFPPGSTFKIVTSLAGLSKGLANTPFTCSGSVEYGGRSFHCWISEHGGSHGRLTLPDAIKVSCNAFFYQYGNAAGGDTLERVGGILGMGKRYELGLSDEKEGCMPGPAWMKGRANGEKWGPAQTANTSIGQGYVLASPLQMAMAYAAVANGGVAYEPRLVKKVLEADGRPALDEKGNVAVPEEPKVREDFRKEGILPEHIELVRKGLWNVINETGGPGGGGTGKSGRVPGTVVAGKTGTAQATDRGQKEHIAWFCCFAPFDHPKYVVVVMVQGGEHGGSVSAPIAARILEQALAVDAGKLAVDLKPLAPAHSAHPFETINSLPAYGATSGIAPVVDDLSDGGSSDSPAQAVQMSHGNASPDIKAEAEADDQGRVAHRPARRSSPAPASSPKSIKTSKPANPSGEPASPQPRRNFLQRIFAPDRHSNSN
ncbi:MAG: penicillin-binding protein 2 [Chthoniobacteraceae bacterium]|nr:penicillin-binding protein 2 [Chthoniobacteraceae bacterium]